MTPTPRHRNERGNSSIIVLLCMTAILMVAGLVIDGGRKTTAAANAQTAANSAARAAANAAATGRLAGSADTTAAAAAARTHLTQSGVQGSVAIDAGGVVTVTASSTSPTLFLSLIGINSVTGTADASATLYGTGETP